MVKIMCFLCVFTSFVKPKVALYGGFSGFIIFKFNKKYTFTKISNFERFYQTPPTGVQADDFLNRKDL